MPHTETLGSLASQKHCTRAICCPYVLTCLALLTLVVAAAPVQLSAQDVSADRTMVQGDPHEGGPSHFGHANGNGHVIPESFFGMHINRIGTPWPSAPVGAQRLLASGVTWCEMEKSPGQYDFKRLDEWIEQAQKNNTPLLYTFVCVPPDFSSDRNDTSCVDGPGTCRPPSDLNADGSGTDAAFQKFVTAMVHHVGNKIQYWEIWNEPSQKNSWLPTDPNLPYSQLIRMAKDAREIIKTANPDALLLTPAPVGYPTGAPRWMNGYLAAGGGAYADVISFHGYLNQFWKQGAYPVAEDEVRLVDKIKAIAAQHGQQNKPLWVSEGGWGNTHLTGFTDPNLQSAFVARYVLLQESLGIAKAFWYQWDNPQGAGKLWKGPLREDVRQPGIAYREVALWTDGANLTSPCVPLPGSGSIWTCTYSRQGGYRAMVVWNTAGMSKILVPRQYKRYRGLMGKTGGIGKSVIIGPWPILLENQSY